MLNNNNCLYVLLYISGQFSLNHKTLGVVQQGSIGFPHKPKISSNPIFETEILNIGDEINIETDILGKYVEKMLPAKDNNSKISMTFLQENGFV